ncbi:unnamed protein product [Caenorhabditis sp. 36 PRJEB53466]|nr:unnamed protein product [Caenorhabditis sp. 36 PRJEB53466]
MKSFRKTGVMSTNDQQTFVINDQKVVKDAPPHILQKLAVDEQSWESRTVSWTYDSPHHLSVHALQYCGDRQLRATAWEKWTSKAGFDCFGRRATISDIIFPYTVRSFINALTRRIRPVVIDRMESWTAWAARCEMITGELQAYDMPPQS